MREAYITFVIEGVFRERYATHTIVCRTGMVRFLPAGEVHENEIQARSRCLHISMRQLRLRATAAAPRHSRKAGRDERTHHHLAGQSALRRIFAPGHRVGMAIEGLVLEILAEIARPKRPMRRCLRRTG